MFLKEFESLRRSGEPTAAPKHIRDVHRRLLERAPRYALLHHLRRSSVAAMRSSRAWAKGMSRIAFGISLVFAGARISVAQATTQGTAVPTAKVIGRVTDTSGVPLPRAEVWLVSASQLRAVADDSGRFELAGLPSGPVTFGVRRLGFESATFSAVLKPGKTHRATFPLTPSAQSLTEVKVQDTASSWLAQFDAHRSSNRGTFITRKDFEKDNLRIASDILRRVPGLQIVQTRTGSAIRMNRGSGARRCTPQLYVHETPYSGNFDDFNPDDIEALEVYVGVSEIPPELINLGRPICAAIVIWTREPPPKSRG